MGTLTKTVVALCVAWLLDGMVWQATGAPLHESVLWSLWHLQLAQAPAFYLGLLAWLTGAGLVYRSSAGLLLCLAGREHIGLRLGYFGGHDRYLVKTNGIGRIVRVKRRVPGELHLDRLLQPHRLLQNPLVRAHWSLRDGGNLPELLLLALACFALALVALGHFHFQYLVDSRPELAATLPVVAPPAMASSLVFLKVVLSYLTTARAGWMALLVGVCLALIGWVKSRSRLPLPQGRWAALGCAPGDSVRATLVETFSQKVSTAECVEYLQAGDNPKKLFYFAVFKISGLHTYPLWLTTFLGSNFPADKNDGRYVALRNELQRRADYEDNSALYAWLKMIETLRPAYRLAVTSDLTLDWTSDRTFLLLP